jgi:hypothetical protein
MMPAQPWAAFVMVQAQFFFQFTLVLFDPPASFGNLNETSQAQRLRTELGQPVLGGLLLTFRPFHQQPLHHPRRVCLFPPSVGCPHRQHRKTRALSSPAPLAPRHRAPSRGGQLLSNLLQTLRPFQCFQGRISPRPPDFLLFRSGHGKVRIVSPDHRRWLDLNGILKMVALQRLPEAEVIAVRRIGQNRQGRQSPRQDLIDRFQGQLRLAPIDRPRRQLDFLGALLVLQPLLRQVEPPQQWTTGFGTRPVQAHRHLAVGNLAQRTAVLSRYPDRVPPGLGKRGLVEDPDFRFTEKIHDFMRQALLDFGHGPGALTHKLAQGLDVCPFDAVGHRFYRFTLPIEEQTSHVDARPVLPFVAPHRFQQVLKKINQSGLETFQSVRLHAAKVTDVVKQLKSNLVLLDPEAAKATIARGIEAGLLGYVGKTAGGDYEPFIYGRGLDPAEVEISDDVYVITKETAENYKKLKEKPPVRNSLVISAPPLQVEPSKKQAFLVSGVDQYGHEIATGNIEWKASGGTIGNDGVHAAGNDEESFIVTAAAGGVSGAATLIISQTLPPPPPPRGVLRWTGEVPAQKWMNFYTKVLAKFAAGKGLKLQVSFEVHAQQAISQQKIEETKAALQEIGLNADLHAD